jgi:hypothetical protein
MIIKEFEFNQEEIRRIDSARNHIFDLVEDLSNVIADKYVDELCSISSDLENAMLRFLDADHEAFKERMDYWDSVRADHKFKAVWSMYRIGNDCMAPVTKELHEAYNNGAPLHYEDIAVSFGELTYLNNVPTWLDFYAAADRAIFRSGDEHHLYIEDFVYDAEKNIIRLYAVMGRNNRVEY